MTDAASSSDKSPSFEMTWGSSTSSGYCSDSDSDSEFEQYFTARTSFIRTPRKEKKVRRTKICNVQGGIASTQWAIRRSIW